MKQLLFQKPEKHVLVCVNERAEEDCCKKVGGETFYFKLKEYIKLNGLSGRIWVTRSRCLGFCNPVGITVVIYPEGEWFTEVEEKDFERILKEINRENFE